MSMSFIESYMNIVESILKRIEIKTSVLGFNLTISLNERQTVDERLVKLEIAKQNLKDGLTAIEELQNDAQNNKKEVENAIAKLDKLQRNKSSLEDEVKAIQEIASADIATFQKLAGVPSHKQIIKERCIGFISGVIASIIASGIIWICTILFQYFK